MFFEFSHPVIKSDSDDGLKAGKIFSDELSKRLGASCGNSTPDAVFILKEDRSIKNRDDFSIKTQGNTIIFTASGIRGFLYAGGMLLRKSEVSENKISLLFDINGYYSPAKCIRGHQLGYRICSNTYDAWNKNTYRNYCTELMFFGVNTVEHIPYEKGESRRNELMQYDEEEFLAWAADDAHNMGLDVSIWYPNGNEDEKTELNKREKLFSSVKYIDSVFIPGSDPGSMKPAELFCRAKKIKKILKKYHPDAKLFISAQQPHDDITWGKEFIEEINKMPEEIYGIIEGPNRAFDIDILRQVVPEKYPLRFYPDITHNLRCEYPVHYYKDDWHYAFSAALGRESINPRPFEFARLNKETSEYVLGSVSYSEGVNDDINKVIWSALDYNPEISVKEILEDYARLYFPGADWKKAAAAIKGLEKNWEGSPENNEDIEKTLSLFLDILKKIPSLYDNWRFISCIFRAYCDVFIKRKFIFENALINEAEYYIIKGDINTAYEILSTPLPDYIKNIRQEIDINAQRLYDLIGMQLSTKKYHASGYERGAVLDMIDLPITDRQYMLKKISEHNFSKDYALSLIKRNDTGPDGYFYSVALHGIHPGNAQQTADFYMDFQGDRPELNNGELEVSCFKLFDHFNFRCIAQGLKDGVPYRLQIIYKNSPDKDAVNHSITINGSYIYKGPQFGGTRNIQYEKDFLPSFLTCIDYDVPAGIIKNGRADIYISEPRTGFRIAKLRLIKQRTEN